MAATTTTATVDADDRRAVVTERVGEYEHLVGDLDYDQPVPSGGDHPPARRWLNCGVYEGEVPDELAVHSLEHGAVWVALGPDSTAADRAAAVELADDAPAGSSSPTCPTCRTRSSSSPGASASRSSRADDPRAAGFVEDFVDASTAPEAGRRLRGRRRRAADPPVYP